MNILRMEEGHFLNCPTLKGNIVCNCETSRYRQMFLVGFICIFFPEAISAYLSGSLSVLADLLHLGTDLFSDIVALCIAGYVLQYGKEKESLIRSCGGYIQGIILFILGVMILFEGIERLKSPGDVNPWIMIGMGTIAAFGNKWRHKILHAGKGHDTSHVTHKSQELHVLVDFSFSISVAIGGVFTLLWENSKIDIYFAIGLSMVIILLLVPYIFYLAYTGKNPHNHAP